MLVVRIRISNRVSIFFPYRVRGCLKFGHSCRDAVARTLWFGHSYYYFYDCDQQADKCPEKVWIFMFSFETTKLRCATKKKTKPFVDTYPLAGPILALVPLLLLLLLFGCDAKT